MKSFNNRQISPKQYILTLLCILLISFGLWFSYSNITKFVKGYNAGEITSKDEQDEQEKELPDRDNENSASVISTGQSLYPKAPTIGEEFGKLYIPKIDTTFPIYEGTDKEELEKGVGHYAGSVLPGEDDNSVLSGHRDTVFRKLGDVSEGDLLIVRTLAGKFQYKVKKIRIVDKDDRTVIVPKPKATLTVSTCYPFHYIGPAPQRYVLVAYLISKEIY